MEGVVVATMIVQGVMITGALLNETAGCLMVEMTG